MGLKKDDIVTSIKNYEKSGIDLCYTNMLNVDCKLVHNATNKFGIGWNALLEKLEINFKPMDKRLSIEQGLKFEYTFKKMLDALNIKYIHNKHIDESSRPDFQLENNILLDCKLSSWTSSIPYTVNKYKDKCEKLIIVFLRGEHKHIEVELNDKLEFRKIDYYYEKLININRQDIIDEFKKILKNEK